MPLTNNVIIKLNEITTMIEDKTIISEKEVEEIKLIFKNLVEKNERYDVDEIEFWFKNEGSWTKKEPIIRIVNLSNYWFFFSPTTFIFKPKFNFINIISFIFFN